MKNFFLFLGLLFSCRGFAQSDAVIATVTAYISAGKYNDAEKYLDSLLQQDPNSIDALMMKGNVLLNYAVMQTPPMVIITPEDESVYSKDLAGLKNPPVLVPIEQAKKIEKLWQHCVEIDSTRLDMREGLCTLYGMADMKQELINYLPVIARAGKAKGNDLVFVLTQYAQLLADRGDKNGAYEVYQKIATLYPNLPAVWCQLSTAYSQNGDLTNAKKYADKAFAGTLPDITVCADALDLYSTFGEYDKALAIMKRVLLADSLFTVYPFYEGIYRYAKHDTGWKTSLNNYVKQFAAAPDSDVLYAAAKYMLAPEFTDSYNNFVQLLTYSNSDFYTGLITERAMRDFKDSILPSFAAAEVLILGHNYAKANTIYAQIEKKKMEPEAEIEYKIQYAYSLYCAGEFLKAITIWTGLSKANNNAITPMADYFIAQCYLKMGNKSKAAAAFQKVTDSKDESKYAYLARVQFDKMAQKK